MYVEYIVDFATFHEPDAKSFHVYADAHRDPIPYIIAKPLVNECVWIVPNTEQP